MWQQPGLVMQKTRDSFGGAGGADGGSARCRVMPFSNPHLLIASAHILTGGLPLVSDESACDRLIVSSSDAADNPAVIGRVIR